MDLTDAPKGTNHSRVLSVIYPNGKVLSYGYGPAGGLDDRISRLDAVLEGANTLEALLFLGLDTVVQRTHPISGVDETFIKLASDPVGDAGDQYTGLDRFGRAVLPGWRKADGTYTDRFQLG
jgi:hypothetical protein